MSQTAEQLQPENSPQEQLPKIDVQVGTLIDQLWEIREERKAIAKQDKELKEQAEALELQIIEELEAQGTDLSRSAKATASIADQEVVSVNDWDEFYDYLKESDQLFLLQRRISNGACVELVHSGEEIPGTEFLRLKKLNLRTR